MQRKDAYPVCTACQHNARQHKLHTQTTKINHTGLASNIRHPPPPSPPTSRLLSPPLASSRLLSPPLASSPGTLLHIAAQLGHLDLVEFFTTAHPDAETWYAFVAGGAREPQHPQSQQQQQQQQQQEEQEEQEEEAQEEQEEEEEGDAFSGNSARSARTDRRDAGKHGEKHTRATHCALPLIYNKDVLSYIFGFLKRPTYFDPFAVDAQNRTPLDYAVENSHHAVAAFLRRSMGCAEV